MRPFACLAALAAVSSLPAQKLETQPSDTTKVIRVGTARDHLTVIEVADTDPDPIARFFKFDERFYRLVRK